MLFFTIQLFDGFIKKLAKFFDLIKKSKAPYCFPSLFLALVQLY